MVNERGGACAHYQIKQLAQMLIFEFSQQAVARGGQAIFSDINLYTMDEEDVEDTIWGSSVRSR